MTEHDDLSYDAVLRAEIAIDLINQARAIVTASVHELEEQDADAAEELRRRRRDLIELQQSISITERDAVEDVIALWGPRVRDVARFWAKF